MSKIEVDEVVNQTGDNDSGVDLSTNDVVAVKTANTERMRVDASGQVGIGTTSPASTFHVSGDNPRGRFTDTPNSVNFDIFMGDDNATVGLQTNHELKIMTNDTERMRISNGGQFTLNPASVPSSPTLSINQSNNTKALAFFTAGTERGNITVFDSSVAFNTSSDYRLKENVVTDWDATSRLKQLKPSRFNFKENKDITVDGFLAHEVSGIIPEAITGEKDAVDKDGNIEAQSIDQSKLVPLLTKALQEAVAKIETLEAKVTALEGA
jgi:hypothetical protein